jgi:hypothetical protein
MGNEQVYSDQPESTSHSDGWVVLGLALFALAGCPDSSGQKPVQNCEKVGQQCQLDGGQLGVCQSSLKGELTCMSQH